MTPLTWRPSRAVFIRRAFLVAVITYLTLYLAPLIIVPFTGAIYFPMVALQIILVSTFFFEDAVRWRRLRDEQWQLTGGTLMHTNDEGQTNIPLDTVKDVKTRLGHVILKLHSGQQIPMRYLPQPSAVVAALKSAMQPAPFV